MTILDVFKKKQMREKLTNVPEKKETAVPNVPEAVPAPKGSSKSAAIVLESAHITEKSARLADTGSYVFRVARAMTKTAIRHAVEELYQVRVERVNTISIPSRAVKHWRRAGTRPGFRKAIVTLVRGQKIEFI